MLDARGLTPFLQPNTPPSTTSVAAKRKVLVSSVKTGGLDQHAAALAARRG
jgi:hypothetical protein